MPDLWSMVTRQDLGSDLPGEQEVENTPFTAAEQAEIASHVDEIKQRLHENLELTTAQISGVEQKLDDLADASKRVGRKDWKIMLYGAAFGMIVNDAVPAHIVQGLITTVISGLGHIFGLAAMPPSLPPTA